jgi:hypothetical protein
VPNMNCCRESRLRLDASRFAGFRAGGPDGDGLGIDTCRLVLDLGPAFPQPSDLGHGGLCSQQVFISILSCPTCRNECENEDTVRNAHISTQPMPNPAGDVGHRSTYSSCAVCGQFSS